MSFFLFGIPSSFVVGWLSDKVNRRGPLFASVILIAEIACFASYFVQNFAGLLITRTITGIGIGGALPVVYSVLSDIYPKEARNAVSGVISTATGLGLGVGQGIAGYMGPTYGWRLPFLIVSIPSIVIAIGAFFLPEPGRGAKEGAVLEALNNQRFIQRMKDEENPRENSSSNIDGNIQSNEEEKEEVQAQEQSQNDDNDDLLLKKDLNISTVSAYDEGSRLYRAELPSLKTTLQMIRTPTVLLILIQG